MGTLDLDVELAQRAVDALKDGMTPRQIATNFPLERPHHRSISVMCIYRQIIIDAENEGALYTYLPIYHCRQHQQQRAARAPQDPIRVENEWPRPEYTLT